MFDWLPNQPLALIALIVLAAMALVTTAIYLVAMRLAKGERAEALKAVSPGMLPPMGILFALIVSILAALYPASRAARIDPVRALRHD